MRLKPARPLGSPGFEGGQPSLPVGSLAVRGSALLLPVGLLARPMPGGAPRAAGSAGQPLLHAGQLPLKVRGTLMLEYHLVRHEVIKNVDRSREPIEQVPQILAEIEPVHAVEGGEQIALCEQDRLPVLARLGRRQRHGRFHDENSGPPVVQRCPPDYRGLVALHIDR